MPKARGSQRISHGRRTKARPNQEPHDRESTALLRELQKLVAEKADRCGNLSAIHRAGQIVRDLRDTQGKSTYGKRWMLALASQIKREWEAEDRSLRVFLYRAREFAEWPEDEVARLAAAKRKTRAGKWASLSWEYVWRMLSVSDPAQRAQLIERWRKQDFSLRAWDREIQQLHDIRVLGRPPARPKTLVDAIVQIEAMARRWQMWFHNNLEKPRRAQEFGEWHESLLEKVPPGLRKLLNQTITPIEEIREKARAAWKRAVKSQAPGGTTTKVKTTRRKAKTKRRKGNNPKA